MMTHDEKEAFFAEAGARQCRHESPPVGSPPEEDKLSRLRDRSAMLRCTRTGGRPRNSDDPLDEPITRGYVAQMLGINVSTVRRLEARGQLHPRIGPGGIRYFQLHEVRRLSRHRLRLLRSKETEMELAAFVMFRKGLDWRDVAIKLRYDPYRVHRLWKLFLVEESPR